MFESCRPDQNDSAYLDSPDADEKDPKNGDKGKVIAQSPDLTGVQASSTVRSEPPASENSGALGAVLAQIDAAIGAGDIERARRLNAVARELAALGFGT